MRKEFSITVDIGTTNSKISLFEISTGKLISRKSFQTPIVNDAFGELFDFDSLWASFLENIVHFVTEHPGDIDSINISSVGEAGVLVDKNGDIVSPLIVWYDKRGDCYIQSLTDKQKEEIYRITGLPAHSNYSISKIKWLIEQTDVSSSQRYTWLTIPDLLNFLLTGEIKTEYSMASRTMCYDLNSNKWSSDVLKMFGLQYTVDFPEVVPSGAVVGTTASGNISSLKGEDISVRIAGHDHMVGALGIKLKSNELLNSTGTTEGLLLIDEKVSISKDKYKDSLSNGIFTDPKYYTLFSSMPTGGNIFSWYRNLFNLSINDLENLCDGLMEHYNNKTIEFDKQLLFIPHLNGSGAPFKNSKSSGLVYGLNLKTKKEDLLFGLIMGLCLEMKHVSKSFPMEEVERLVVIGPAIKNPLWLQMKADALNKTLSVVEMEEAVSFGALKTSYNEFDYQPEYQIINPDKEMVQVFNDLMEEYIYLYEAKKRLLEY